MSQNGKHCLVFGASGISGWALLNASVNYPSPTTFHRITGLCNRPLTKEAAYLPADPRINLVSGIDLTGSVESVVKALKEKVEQVETVSIVYFCGMFRWVLELSACAFLKKTEAHNYISIHSDRGLPITEEG